MRRFLLLALATTAFGACDDPYQPRSVPCDQFLLDYQPVGPDTVTTTAGVRYIDVELGSSDEAAAIGKVVEVNYTGYLLDGTRFDTSCSSNWPTLRTPLGGDQTLPAFDIGIVGMEIGGIRRFIIPASEGYPPQTQTVGGKDLVFDVELLEVF